VGFPNGDVIYGGRVEKPVKGNTSSVEVALNVRAHDISSVLYYMKIQKSDKVVIFSQSFSEAAIVTSILSDSRIMGRMYSWYYFRYAFYTPKGAGHGSCPRSLVLSSSEGDGQDTSTDVSWGQFWDMLAHSSSVKSRKEMIIVNSMHESY
jgi:hypothetical protein